MDAKDDSYEERDFFVKAMKEYGLPWAPVTPRVLDFGCGRGGLVAAFQAGGFEAYGCDFQERLGASEALRPIEASPYRLPFDDGSFDVVVSTAVLEHAQNIEECSREIRRVLRPGGLSMHVFPGRKYLPIEPHIRVPLMNWFWPWRPRAWLAFWALLGVRQPEQKGMPWRAVLNANDSFMRDHCSYLSTKRHSEVSKQVFGNYEWPMRFYIEHAHGGVGRLGRRLPLHGLTGAMSREFRMAFLVQRNEAGRPE